MKVDLYSIVADCPSCHGTDFEPQGGKRSALASQTSMLCTGCGTRINYIQLLIQIGDKAIARSMETIARIKAQRARTLGRSKSTEE